jgi:hypothetical protein
MAQVYLHCSNSHGRLLDRRVAEVDDLFEARDHAEAVARSLIAGPDLQDWRFEHLEVGEVATLTAGQTKLVWRVTC